MIAKDDMYFPNRFTSRLEISAGSDDYDNKIAWFLAEMAHLAYARFEDGSPDVLAKPLQDVGFDLLNSYSGEKKGTQAFLALRAERDMAVLSYRGTDDLRAWKQNLEAKRDDGPSGGKIHGGFWEAFRDVEQTVASDLKALDGVPVYVTGHSLGGALAILAGYFFSHNPELKNTPICVCYTFGGPRVGNRTFRKNMNDTLRVHRIVRQGDAVPGVPLPPLFRHVGEIYYFDDQNRRRTGVSAKTRYAKFIKDVVEDAGEDGIAVLKAHDHRSYADQLGEYALAQL